ncbi:hypothetical protein CsSME_00036000 [Camellia sinensis var. sinensis]
MECLSTTHLFKLSEMHLSQKQSGLAYGKKILPPYHGNLTMSDIGLAEKRIYHAALNGSNNRLPSVLHRKDD